MADQALLPRSRPPGVAAGAGAGAALVLTREPPRPTLSPSSGKSTRFSLHNHYSQGQRHALGHTDLTDTRAYRTYLSYSWKDGATTFQGNVLPALTSVKATASTVVTVTATDRADASLSMGLISAEAVLSTPVEATTALGSTPAGLNGVAPTFNPGNGPTPGAGAGLAALRDMWILMAAAGFAVAAGVGMVVL